MYSSLSGGPIHRLIYYSRQRIKTGDLDRQIGDILAASVRNNAKVEVSGLLIAHQGWFVQVLEGAALDVQTTLGRISHDHRHSESKIISVSPVEERLFGAWAMCAPSLTTIDDEILTALDLRGPFRPSQLKKSTALKLLLAVQGVQARVRRRVGSAPRPVPSREGQPSLGGDETERDAQAEVRLSQS